MTAERLEANAREVSDAAGEVAGLRLRVAALEDALGAREGEAEAARRREVALAETVGDLRVSRGRGYAWEPCKAGRGGGVHKLMGLIAHRYLRRAEAPRVVRQDRGRWRWRRPPGEEGQERAPGMAASEWVVWIWVLEGTWVWWGRA